MERYAAARNIAIIAAIAAAVYFIPRGGQVANSVAGVISVAFAGAVAYFAGRMYIQHRATIYGLGDRLRGLLYGAVAVAVVTIAAQPRMWQTTAGQFVWIALLAGVVYALVYVFRSSRSY